MHPFARSVLPALTLSLLTGLPLVAAETSIAFKGLRAAQGEPVEITADSLELDQDAGTAHFTGHVLVIQGQVRLSSNDLVVTYAKGEASRIDHMVASGDVLLASDSEEAKAERATYAPEDHNVQMTGDVVLTQGNSVMSGQSLFVDLTAGTGRMEGRVKTILNAGGTAP